MTEWYELLKYQRGEQKRLMKDEGATGRYTRIVISLATAQSDELLDLNGDYIGVASIRGEGTCKIRLDHRHAEQINLKEVEEIASPFGKIYFESDGAGGELVIYIGGALTARLKPVQSKVSLRHTDGSDMNACRDRRFRAHTFGSLKPTTQGVANTAQPLLAATKVRWAIVHFLSKVTLIGTSTVTRGGGADDGQKYAENSYLTIEHVDLGDVYIINHVLGEQCIYSINYITEA